MSATLELSDVGGIRTGRWANVAASAWVHPRQEHEWRLMSSIKLLTLHRNIKLAKTAFKLHMKERRLIFPHAWWCLKVLNSLCNCSVLEELWVTCWNIRIVCCVSVSVRTLMPATQVADYVIIIFSSSCKCKTTPISLCGTNLPGSLL